MTPSTMADKLRQRGSMRIEKPIGDKVRRIAELSIEAKVFGLGGLIESTTESSCARAGTRRRVLQSATSSPRRAKPPGCHILPAREILQELHAREPRGLGMIDLLINF